MAEVFRLAENDTFNSRQSFMVYLSNSIKILTDFLTGYASKETHQNTCPMLVHLLVRFGRSFRLNLAEIMNILPLKVDHEIDRYFCKAQARKRKSTKAFRRRRAVSVHHPTRRQVLAFGLQIQPVLRAEQVLPSSIPLCRSNCRQPYTRHRIV